MALLTCALTLAALAGCEPDRATASHVLGTDRISAVVYPESVSVVNLCGPRMSIRNANDDSVAVQYAPSADAPRTTVTLPKRPAGTPYSETFVILTGPSGVLFVWIGARRTDKRFPGSTCAVRPVVPATPPLSLTPSTPGTTFLTASDSNYRGVVFSDRRIFVMMRPQASQQVRQALFDAARVKVVGGIPSRGEGLYIVELDQPVTGTLGPVRATVDLLVRNAAVLRALPEDDGGFVRPLGVSPRDATGWQQWTSQRFAPRTRIGTWSLIAFHSHGDALSGTARCGSHSSMKASSPAPTCKLTPARYLV